MRRNGTYWKAVLDQAAKFNQLELCFLGSRDGAAELQIRGRNGFIPVHQYGHGMLPLRGEIGSHAGHRYIRR